MSKRGRRVFVAVMAMVASIVAVAAPSSPADAETIFSQYVKTAPGPRGAVTVIGDSVMLGSVLETDGYGPSVSQMLVDRGWGPVRAVAGVGLQTGLHVSNPGANMAKWVLDRRAEGWDSPVYMVGLGSNDVGNCNNSQSCAERDILYLLDTIGPDRIIWWSLITGPTQAAAEAWNGALRAVAADHPNLVLWDWPAALAASDIVLSSDHVHLPTGAQYRKKSALMADDFTTRVGVSRTVDTTWGAPAVLGGPSQYQPLSQQRVYDSRDLGARPPSVQIDVSRFVPPGTTAVSINLTAVATPNASGYLTAYPCGAAPPLASSVNFGPGQIRPNQVVVGLGAGNLLCVAVSAPADVIVDLQGAFVPSGGLTLNPLAPARLIDTRVVGRTDPLTVPVPAPSAAGVVVNVTAVGAAGPGYLVVYACDGPVPNTSNLNFVAGTATAGSAYVGLGAAGTLCVHASQPVDVIVDLQGTFVLSGGLRFQAANPQRMLDTRVGTGGWFGQVGMAQTIDVSVAPAGVQAVTGNLTMVQPGVDGYAAAFGCSFPLPSTSSVNAGIADVAANSVTLAVSAGGPASDLCIHSSVGSHMIFDTTGWWLP
jgi:hypothetical protein